MQTDQFAPFMPPKVTTGDFEDKSTDDSKGGKPAKPKRERKSRAAAKKPKPAKAAIPPAPNHVRPTRKNTKARKPRTPSVKAALRSANVKGKRALKLDITSAMAISAMLKPADFKMFESLTETLQSVNKATRKRLLAAIGKVFG